ncbi:hypothetical protein IPH92_05055 [Candidatus Kaiserbacteria bacterium]|nr:MAG: hypothetical protein IPH92_05055 [Candidatus Kaiserbacteria bacterium]
MNNNHSALDVCVPLHENKSFCILLTVAFALALISSFIFWNIYVVERSDEQGIEGIPEAQQTTQTEDTTTTQQDYSVYPERVLTGMLVTLSPDVSFVRVLVKDEGVYLIGLGPETKTTIDGSDANINTLSLMSTVSVTAYEIPDTEPYDFFAKNITGGSISSTNTNDLGTISATNTDQLSEEAQSMNPANQVQPDTFMRASSRSPMSI